MAKQRTLSEIRKDISFHRMWIRRLEDDGGRWREVQGARARLLELQNEEFRVIRGHHGSIAA